MRQAQFPESCPESRKKPRNHGRNATIVPVLQPRGPVPQRTRRQVPRATQAGRPASDMFTESES